MYTTLATRLVIDKDGEVSQPVSMEGFNSAAQDVTAYHIVLGSGTAFEIKIEGSNDLENWTDVGNLLSLTAESYAAAAVLEVDISFAFIRLRYGWQTAGDATTIAIINSGINSVQE